MKAVALTHYLPIEDPNSFLDVYLPKPEAAGRDLLVAVKAVSVNPVDTKIRAPKDGVEDPPKVLGWDASGVVEAVGPDVTLFKVGDEVFYAGDLTRPGSNSEFQLIDERIVGPKPTSLSFAEAAALPLTTITAYESFFDHLGIARDGADSGQSILIIGAGGGVGSIGIQLAKAAGLVIIATASRPETDSWVRELGADHVVNHREPMVEQVRALGMQHVDHIAIFNDMRHWETAVELIRPQGAIVSIDATNLPMPMDQPALGIHVHALDVRDARHDRAAQSADLCLRRNRRRAHPHDPQRGDGPDQRRDHARRPRAHRDRDGKGQDRSRGVLSGPTSSPSP